MVNALLSQLFLECVAGLNDRKRCIFTNDMKLTRQNMKYFVFILSAMKYKSLFLFAFSILSQPFLIWGCRYVFLCFYFVASGTYCGGSEFKYPGSVPKS